MTAADAAYRPQLRPGLRPLWRSSSCLQLGDDPDRAVMIDDVDPLTARIVLGLDGSRSIASVLTDATAAGADIDVITTLLAGLRRCDLVVDAEPVPLSALGTPDTTERLAPDHAGLSVRGRDTPIDTLRGRRDRLVAVHGANRIGAVLASLLAAAGVGAIRIVDAATARPADAAPGGLTPGDSYTPRRIGAEAAVRRAAPEARIDDATSGARPDLVVLASGPTTDPRLLQALHRLRIPHLPIGLRGGIAVLGPLVVPGRSTCLNCADLHRQDRDPTWPRLAAQLSIAPRHGHDPAEVVLTAAAAAIAAAHALEWLDGGTPPSVGGTVELLLPAPQLRHRRWIAHPGCHCGAARSGDLAQS